MSDSNFWLIKTGAGEHWEYWKEKEIISVGWGVGKVENKSEDELREKVKNEFDYDSAGGPVGHILSIAGQHWDENQNMGEDDYAVAIGTKNIDGYSVVCGVAQLNDYEYSEDGVDGTGTHPYHRNADYIYDDGPVKRKNLPDKFKQGGENTVHIASTRCRWKSGDKKAVDELVESLEEAETEKWGSENYQEKLVNSYFENNKAKLEEGFGFSIDEIESEMFLTEEGNHRVDLFCVLDDGSICIIEIKSGEAGTDALEQLNRYTRRQRKLNENDVPVKGVIMAEKFTNELKESSEEVKLCSYGFSSELDLINK